MSKSGLATLILLSLISGCAGTTRVVQKTEVPLIPGTLLMLPAFPDKPGPPRSNGQMYEYRRQLEQTLCETMHRSSEIVRFATLGQQAVDVDAACR